MGTMYLYSIKTRFFSSSCRFCKHLYNIPNLCDCEFMGRFAK